MVVVVVGAAPTVGPQADDVIPSSSLDYMSGFSITSSALEGKAEQIHRSWTSFRHLRRQLLKSFKRVHFNQPHTHVFTLTSLTH